jgi:predicted transcriptional regulator
MDKTLSSQAAPWREGGGLLARELHQKGWQQQAIAKALGVTQGAASQWLKRGKEGGSDTERRKELKWYLSETTLLASP